MPDLGQRLLHPRPGWSSLVLLAIMALALAWSVQTAAWLERLDFLAAMALWAVVAGAAFGILRWTIVASLPLAALLGAGLALWAIGGEYFPLLSDVERLFALRTEFLEWLATVLRTGYPLQLTPYAVGLGILMWATCFTASYVVYRDHRVVDAILLMGAALIANMSATLTNLFQQLLLFVGAALLLWLRAALVTRQEGWQRRRVNENVEVPPAIMRTGLAVAAGSVLLAWALTSVAVASPLTGAWRSLDGVWTTVRDQFEGVFGSLQNPGSRITGSSFGRNFTVFGEWVSNDAEVLVLAAERPLYLRARTYDSYTGRGWVQTEGPTRDVPAGDLLFPGEVATTERPLFADAVRIEEIGIEVRQSIGRNLLTAGSPLRIFAPSRVEEPGGYPLIGSIEGQVAPASGEAYTLRVALSEATEAELELAGTDYPAEVRALYLGTDGITDRVAELAREVTARADNPYRQAKALAAYLRGAEFTYSTVGPEIPGDADLVDTFLFGENGRVGYCQYYASAMALMARSLGIPARVAVGFAPGERLEEPGLSMVREANAHAWVEIYFPGYGWEIFEATKSINPGFVRASGNPDTAQPPSAIDREGLLEELFANEDAAGEFALPSPVLVPGGFDPDNPEQAPSSGSAARTGNVLVMAVLTLGALVVVWWQSQRAHRRWLRVAPGDRSWRRLTLAAERAGVGPKPSETIYEYAGWLEDQLPHHLEPIRTVADGKVAQAYSGRTVGMRDSARLDAAWKRLRMPLFFLAVRRWLRRASR